MRILIVTHYYAAHRGGIEIVAAELATRLARTHTVTWIASDSDAPLPAGSPVRSLPMPTWNLIERWTGLPLPIWGISAIRRIWVEVRRAEIVHLHDFSYFGNVVAFCAAAVFGRPVVITQHIGDIPYSSRALRFVLKGLHRTLGRRMLKSAALVVFVSPVVAAYFRRFVTYERQPRVLNNGVDTRTYAAADRPGQEAARSGLRMDSSRPILLFVGRFVEKKGLKILRELVARTPDIHWLFAGWGPLDPADWNAPNVSVFHDLVGADLVPLFQAADLLVLPSVGEGLPLVVQESMSCGTPAMVGSDTARAVDAPAGLLFSARVGGPDTVGRWESSLRERLGDLAELRGLRPAVARLARQRWSWQRCAEDYERLFAMLTSGRQTDTNQVQEPGR